MLIVAVLFLLFMIYYAGYLVRCWWYFGKIRSNENHDAVPMVSVIVPARNEEKNIENILECLFSQKYPEEKYEVILVDDDSEDRTRELAERAASGRPGFRLVRLGKIRGSAYKKAAVQAGINESRGEIILTTDADCTMGHGWIRAMATAFSENTAMVSGPVALDSNNVFGHFQALEFMGLIAVGAGSIRAGNPNMCNGANLAYRKSAFLEVGGFEGIDHIASGDDELLMHKLAAAGTGRIAFAKKKGAIVWTKALGSWREFRDQRVRWVSKSTQYKKRSITFTLVISWLAIFGIPLMGAMAIFDHRIFWLFLASLGLKIFGEWIVLQSAARFFNKLHLLIYLLPEQVAHIAYVLWVGLAGNRRKYKWKGRTVK